MRAVGINLYPTKFQYEGLQSFMRAFLMFQNMFNSIFTIGKVSVVILNGED